MNAEITTNQMRNPKENNTVPTAAVISSASKSINDMSNWEIITYLREKREWMVLPAYTRKYYKDNFDLEFNNNEEWSDFTTSMCDKWDNIIGETIGALVE